jgi:tRNA (guanine-N7-)-methyltransferase
MTRNPYQVALWPAGLYRRGALAELREYGQPPFDLAREFGRAAPTLLEIGPGRGHFLLETAAARPDWSLLGLEISRKRSDSLTRRALRQGLDNVLVLNAVAEMALGSLLGTGFARELHIHFPDPWPKKRHHKRRLLGPAVAPRLLAALEPGGLLCVMTDHEDYALEALQSLEALGTLRNLAGPGRFAPRPDEPTTFYQRLSLDEGRSIHYLRMVRPGPEAQPGQAVVTIDLAHS